MNGTYTDDSHLTSDQLEYAAVMDAREADTQKTLRAARHVVAEPWYKTHANKPYTAPTSIPAAAYDTEDVVLTKTGPAVVTDSKYVEATRSWVYAVHNGDRTVWVRDQQIIGKAL